MFNEAPCAIGAPSGIRLRFQRNIVSSMSDLIVPTEQGKVRGKSSLDYYGGSFYTFSGIPYAKAPVGALRFKAPQPPESWEGVRDCTKEGYECPSLDMYFGYHIGHEDNCLNLNVYTKELPFESSKKKPVMVWVHGGGFIYGSNKSDNFGPHYLMTEDIVLVAINYRLGVFGFLSLNDETLGVPGNAGLKDQTMALRWVQKNIHHFGGNPNNVTVFGESAGGASVHYLTLSPLTKGLFHKAIIQSGSALNPWAKGKRNASEIAKALFYKETDEKLIFQKLCKESAKSIVSAQFRIKDTFFANLVRPLGPVVEKPHEGAFLTEDPVDIMRTGRQHQVPMIMGYNSMEGMFYEVIRRTRSEANLPKNLECEVPYSLGVPLNSETSKEIAEKIKRFYYEDEEISEKNITKRYLLVSDVEFVHGIHKSVQLMKQGGNHPLYVYRMSYDGPLNFFKRFCQVRYFKTLIVMNLVAKLSGNTSMKNVIQNLSNKLPANNVPGTAHADDLFYLFTTFFTPKIVRGSEEDAAIQKFVKLWTNFARHGNPTPEIDETIGDSTWAPVNGPKVEPIFDLNKDAKPTGNLEGERVRFWEGIYHTYTK